MVGDNPGRKNLERDLHDHLRGTAAHDQRFTSNKKFYAIAGLNVHFVETWVRSRCQGKQVLDFCCGNGEYSLSLAEMGATVHGIDISPVSIENARKEAADRGLADRATFSVMDAEAMEFADNSFDLAVVNGVLHHLDLEKAYSELARVLAPDGAMIATEALRHNKLIHRYRQGTPHLRSAWEVDHILGKSDIELASRYFADVKVLRWFHLATLAAIPFRDRVFFRPLLRALAGVDALILRIPGIRWQAWMAVFEVSKPRKPAA